LFLGNIANGWDVQNDQRDETKFRNQDLQVGMSAGTSGTISASMKHKMGLIQVNMPSQTVYLTRYYQYVNNEWELNNTKNSNVANQTTASGATDFTNSTWKPWAKTTSSCYLIGKPDDGALPISANRGTSNSYYSWEVTDKEITAANAIVTENLSISSTYLKQAWEFSYTGTGQSFTIPAAGTYCFECWGAQGGDATRIYNYGPDTKGGKGGYASGTFIFTVAPTLYVYVGQDGGLDNTTSTRSFGGGGGGYGSVGTSSGGTRGGGATDIRLISATASDGWSGDNSLKTRLIIAGGGGGTSYWFTETNKEDIVGSATGGGGGGLNGCSGKIGYRKSTFSATEVSSKGIPSGGGTQTSGGTQSKWDGSVMTGTIANAGVYGMGASGTNMYQGSGGGGHYGGATSGCISALVSTGGGGSGFVSGASGCVAISGYRDANDASQVRYNNVSYKCTESSLINGESSLPISTGLFKESYGTSDKETGHSGNGFARITQISTN